jgi:hypothetical protein
MHLARLPSQVSRGNSGWLEWLGESPEGVVDDAHRCCALRRIEGRISSSSILPKVNVKVKVKAVNVLYLNQMRKLSLPGSTYPRRLPTCLPNTKSH